MRVLAVETATPLGSVSLVDEGGVILERESGVAITHSTWLLPAIRDLLIEAQLSPGELDGFAVSVGPGSFTGLRIGLSTVKGLSLATGKPVVPVPTLDAMAELVPPCPHLICPLLDARKKEVYAALYRHLLGGPLHRQGDFLVLSPHALAHLIDEKVLFLGNGSDLYRELLVRLFGDKALFASANLRYPKAATVGQLGLRLLKQGCTEDLDGLEPLYVRPSEAELKRRSRSER
jgi:tRNA threonylcarbamoyladenosine biosynthesis protein TsaB